MAGQRGGIFGFEGNGGVIVVAYKIGRGPANDIVVEDSSVSRSHAELRVTDDKCVLVDLGSTNGTCVRENGRWIEIEKASVARDERILLGEVVTTVTALIERRSHEPQSLSVRSAPANEFTAPGRGGRGDADAIPASAAPLFDEGNDHARLIGRRRRPGRSTGGDAAPMPRREPEPPSRGPIVQSGIAARVNGTPDAGPDRVGPRLSGHHRPVAPAPSASAPPAPAAAMPRSMAPDGQSSAPPRSTPYLRVPAALSRRRSAAADVATPSGDAPVPAGIAAVFTLRQHHKWLAVAAVGALFAVTAVVATMRYGSTLAGIIGFDGEPQAQVAAAAPARKAAPTATPAAKSPVDREWQRFVGGPGDDGFAAAARYRDGGTILVGTTTAGMPANPDLWAVRLDRNGKILWRRAFGGPNADHGLAVAAARDGGALVAGETDNRGAAWMLRLDDTGQKRWAFKLSIGARSAATAAVEVPGGGFAVLVVGRDARTAADKTVLVRLDDDGKELWRRPLHKGPVGSSVTSSVRGTDLVAIRKTGFAVAGTRKTDEGKTALWVARIDDEGKTVWQRTLPQAGRDARPFVRLARRDDLIVGATHLTDTAAPSDGTLRLVRLDRDGDTLWDRSVKARAGIRVTGMFLVKRGIIVAGIEDTETSWTARIDTAGAIVWERRFAGLKAGQANTIVERGRGHILVAGRVQRGERHKQDGLLLFLNRAGRPES